MPLNGVLDVVRPEPRVRLGDEIPVELVHNDRDVVSNRNASFLYALLRDIITTRRQWKTKGTCVMIFNERLKLLRVEHSLTQEKAAQAIGIPPRSYQRLELDGNKTHYDTLLKIADYYQVSVDWLMGRTDVRELQIN